MESASLDKVGREALSDTMVLGSAHRHWAPNASPLFLFAAYYTLRYGAYTPPAPRRKSRFWGGTPLISCYIFLLFNRSRTGSPQWARMELLGLRALAASGTLKAFCPKLRNLKLAYKIKFTYVPAHCWDKKRLPLQSCRLIEYIQASWWVKSRGVFHLNVSGIHRLCPSHRRCNYRDAVTIRAHLLSAFKYLEDFFLLIFDVLNSALDHRLSLG